MAKGAGVDGPSESPERYVLPPRPSIPTRLPTLASNERLRAFVDGLDDLADDEHRVAAVRDELRACRHLAKYLTAWRTFYCARMWLADVPTHVIAKAAGVADSYVSKRARTMGYEPRRNDKRRDG